MHFCDNECFLKANDATNWDKRVTTVRYTLIPNSKRENERSTSAVFSFFFNVLLYNRPFTSKANRRVLRLCSTAFYIAKETTVAATRVTRTLSANR